MFCNLDSNTKSFSLWLEDGLNSLHNGISSFELVRDLLLFKFFEDSLNLKEFGLEALEA